VSRSIGGEGRGTRVCRWDGINTAIIETLITGLAFSPGYLLTAPVTSHDLYLQLILF
jgi:hypothetical protein